MLMSSAHVSQVAKAVYYREEPFRFQVVNRNTVILKGDNAKHVLVRVQGGSWSCDCLYAEQSSVPCGHVMALEHLLATGQLGQIQETELSSIGERCSEVTTLCAPVSAEA